MQRKLVDQEEDDAVDTDPALGPAAAAVSHSVGQQEAVAGGGQVENSLGDDEADSEEQVAGRQEGDDQQHQTEGQSPGSERTTVSHSLHVYY